MSVLVATDLAHTTFPAIHMGALIANARNTSLRLLHVVDFTGDDNAWRVLYETADEIEHHATQEATARLVANYNDAVPEDHHRAFSTTVRFGRPADGILAEATDQKPELIVVGTGGQSGLQDIFFVRTSNQLVREAHLPVLAVPPSTSVGPIKRILVAADLSICGDRALATAKQYADLFGASVDVIHAVDVDTNPPLSALVSPIQTRFDALLGARHETLAEHVAKAGLEGAKMHVEIGRPDLDWVRLANGMGVKASRATTAEEFNDQFDRALSGRGPHLIEAVL